MIEYKEKSITIAMHSWLKTDVVSIDNLGKMGMLSIVETPPLEFFYIPQSKRLDWLPFIGLKHDQCS